MPQTVEGKNDGKKEEIVPKAKSTSGVSSSSKEAGGGPKTSATIKPTTKAKTSVPFVPPKTHSSGGASATAAAKAASAAKAAIETAKANSVPLPPPTTSSSITMEGNKRQHPTPSSAGSASKKRPYRRTKRPKNYCDKSTVTTTTPTAQLPVNVFDAVLGECDDLLRASLEAQQLGRLKIASAYQLLLHTRLVGLGKRFDRSTIMPPLSSSRRKPSPEDDEEDDDDEYEMGYHGSDSPIEEQLAIEQQNAPPSATAMAAAAEAENVAADATPSAFPAGLEQLTSVLPSNIEMDASMMEHLARAAVELHHQRTGRKKSADGLLASPMTGLIGTPPVPTTTASLTQPKGAASGKSTGKAAAASGLDTTSSKVAWSQDELNVVHKCLKENKQPYTIAKLLPSKTEAQVKAYIKNQQKMTVAHVKSAKKSLNGEEMDGGDDDHDGTEITPNSAAAAKKRGGRGRKPPTTAMNTVPNANLDAKSLLQRALEGQAN